MQEVQADNSTTPRPVAVARPINLEGEFFRTPSVIVGSGIVGNVIAQSIAPDYAAPGILIGMCFGAGLRARDLLRHVQTDETNPTRSYMVFDSTPKLITERSVIAVAHGLMGSIAGMPIHMLTGSMPLTIGAALTGAALGAAWALGKTRDALK